MKKKTIVALAVILLPLQAFANSFDTNMSAILEDYLKIQEFLSSDQTDNIVALSKRIHEKAKKLSLKEAPSKFANHYKNTPKQILESSLKLSKEKSIEGMREAFKGLSRPIANWTEMNQPQGASIFYCSMAKASWVQKSEKAANPYYGKKMLTCGEKVTHHKPSHDHAH